jgi:hypothetical protein
MRLSAADHHPASPNPAAAPLWRRWLAEAGSVAGTLALMLVVVDAYAPDLAVFGGQPQVRVRWLLTSAALIATAHLLVRWRAAAHAAGARGSGPVA